MTDVLYYCTVAVSPTTPVQVPYTLWAVEYFTDRSSVYGTAPEITV